MTYRPLAAALASAGFLLLTAHAQPDHPQPPPAPDGVEVQTRGPVHEAFAEPAAGQAAASPVVPGGPPDPVEELPPDQRPEGAAVVWVSGYWGYDDERRDYLWVSGFWRVPPPGRAWMPGHWQSVAGGSQWVAGFWSAPEQEQTEYLPPPPAPLDAGPSTPPPEPGQVYAPGCWVYRATRYVWRPGFWHAHRPGWAWTPAAYAWTPAGSVFVDGYWDYPLDRRGLLFAPVVFDRTALAEASFRYTPSYVVNTDFLVGALFARPAAGHYYFGDYFGPAYAGAGYVPWVDYRASRWATDPLFDSYRLERGAGGRDGAWERDLRQLYAGRAGGRVPPPPRTLVQQNQAVQTFASNTTNVTNTSLANGVTSMTAVTPLGQWASRQAAGRGTRLERVPPQQLAEVRRGAAEYRDLARRRGQAEAGLAVAPDRPGPGAAPAAPRTLRLQRPPEIAGAPPAPRPPPSPQPQDRPTGPARPDPARPDRPAIDRPSGPPHPGLPPATPAAGQSPQPDRPLPPPRPGSPDRPGAPSRPGVPDHADRPGPSPGTSRPALPVRPDSPRPGDPAAPPTPPSRLDQPPQPGAPPARGPGQAAQPTPNPRPTAPPAVAPAAPAHERPSGPPQAAPPAPHPPASPQPMPPPPAPPLTHHPPQAAPPPAAPPAPHPDGSPAPGPKRPPPAPESVAETRPGAGAAGPPR